MRQLKRQRPKSRVSRIVTIGPAKREGDPRSPNSQISFQKVSPPSSVFDFFPPNYLASPCLHKDSILSLGRHTCLLVQQSSS